MQASSVTPVIYVSEFQRTLDYYTTILGFSEDFKLEAYAGLVLDDILIYISAPANQGIQKPPGQTLFCINCDEVDTYFDAISKKGALILGPPTDRYYGIRDFAVNDPDGNTLVFGSTIQE
jgi:catechol 2,3-dioxygenase-like lactoylglutathione lyase family enzyme